MDASPSTSQQISISNVCHDGTRVRADLRLVGLSQWPKTFCCLGRRSNRRLTYISQVTVNYGGKAVSAWHQGWMDECSSIKGPVRQSCVFGLVAFCPPVKVITLPSSLAFSDTVSSLPPRAPLPPSRSDILGLWTVFPRCFSSHLSSLPLCVSTYFNSCPSVSIQILSDTCPPLLSSFYLGPSNLIKLSVSLLDKTLLNWHFLSDSCFVSVCVYFKTEKTYLNRPKLTLFFPLLVTWMSTQIILITEI